MRTEIEDMFGIVGIDFPHQIDPRRCFGGVAKCDRRRPVQVERRDTVAFDPAAFGNQSAVDRRRLARRPRHLLDRPMFVEPDAGPAASRLSLSSLTGVPSFFSIGTAGRRELTLLAGHISRVGTKMYEWPGM